MKRDIRVIAAECLHGFQDDDKQLLKDIEAAIKPLFVGMKDRTEAQRRVSICSMARKLGFIGSDFEDALAFLDKRYAGLSGKRVG